MSAADVSSWPFSVRISVKLRTFFGSLHWPSSVVELGAGGISYVELLILYERWASERLTLEMAVPKIKRAFDLL